MASGQTVTGKIMPVMIEPYDYGTGGHYNVSHRCAIVATQAANSRLFEIRNPSSSLVLVPTRIAISWLPTAAHTAAIEDSLDVFKVTGFTAVDTVNTVTPVAHPAQTSRMTAAASAAGIIRGVTVAGAAAGMTGGTLTKSGSQFLQLAQWLLLAQPTGSTVYPVVLDWRPRNGEHPLVLETDEGIIIENRVLLGAAAGSSVYIEVSYAEIPKGGVF